jgi:deoxycytidylate deaminase
MEARQQKTVSKVDTQPSDTYGSSISSKLEGRKTEELILAFAGPIGCGIKFAITEATSALESLSYEVKEIKLSEFINKHAAEIFKPQQTNSDSDAKKRIVELQDRGNNLRKEKGNDILAQYAIEEVVHQRGLQREADKSSVAMMDYVPKRTAYLINQIKHPDEVALLRTVYGQIFNLIGVISISEKRSNRLVGTDNILAGEVSALMERDRRQEENNGQQLDKALQMADFFISTDHNTTPALQKKLKRFLDLLHGENGLTPTSQEYGMYAAFSAGLKSACLSRQVGAAIADRTGKIISTGCNDVPKAMGGLYSADDSTDRRCVHKEDKVCFNDKEKIL